MPKLQALLPAREGRLGMALDGALGGWTRGVKDYRAPEPTILRLVEGIIGRFRCRVTYHAPGQQQPRTYPSDSHRLLSVQGGYPAAERAALLPSVVRLMLASFLEGVEGADGTQEGTGAR